MAIVDMFRGHSGPPNDGCCKQVVANKSRSLVDKNIFQNLNYSYAKVIEKEEVTSTHFPSLSFCSILEGQSSNVAKTMSEQFEKLKTKILINFTAATQGQHSQQ